ncbi:ADP-ribosylation-containing protein [Dioscorea alata]|uniref:ADP-ribosylation-containing protein n=1 Tax=Dioscorea alata TaxID=55571 RepID=A0ACB7WIH6_DIOAL|nr:ADP-ribosylation-containing protein [Dioscorea alata]
MATGWVKSLQCISNALDDVVSTTTSPSANTNPTKKKQSNLLPITCGNPSHTLQDVVLLFPKHPPPGPPPTKKVKPPSSRNAHHPNPKRPKTKANPNPRSPAPIPPPKSLPTLTELPAGHSSRRVVEIIFASSWSSRGTPFPGEIEMLFRVHNPTRTVSRFEDYRAAVQAAAEGANDGRCAADGNEMMRFQCAPPSSSASAAAAAVSAADDVIYDARVVACSTGGIRTFAGSGGAHESVGGGSGRGRRSMLVCRVIAGRVRSGTCEPSGRFESVSSGRGELLVFDSRAVLPCFLIIYRL